MIAPHRKQQHTGKASQVEAAILMISPIQTCGAHEDEKKKKKFRVENKEKELLGFL